MKNYYRVKAEINLDAIVENIKRTKQVLKPDTKIMSIIKADGYGHGAVPIAKVLNNIVDSYGVAILEEAVELRKAGITKPILILGFTPEQLYFDLVKYEIIATVFCYDDAKKIAKEAISQNKIAKIHLKLDTGMSRIGFLNKEESIQQIKEIAKLKGIEINGIFTHFAKADETDKSFSYQQFEQYKQFICRLEEENIFIPIKHISNSAAIIDLPEVNLDMVRIGISLYGLYPSDQVKKENLYLEPAMSIKAYLSYVKQLPEGCSVSYGGTFITKRPTKIATIPVGYADGYPRTLSNKGRVLIHGKSAPILGRICMDQFMVDVTDIKGVKAGDIAVLLGKDKEESITVEELAELSGVFHYEIVCDIGKRVPRVYYYKEKKVGTLDFYDCATHAFYLEM